MNRNHIALAAFAALAVTAAGCPAEKKPIAHPTPVPAAMATATPVPAKPPQALFVALPEQGNPLVAIRIAFRTGSQDDPPGKEGLAALTASVMADGGTKKLSSKELVRALYPMAASIAARTDREMTVFSARVHKDHLAQFLPILADVILEPRLDAKEFERLKADSINDLTLRLRTSDDENLGKELLETMLAPGHGYGHPPGGTESGLKAITLADVESFRKQAFGQARLIVGIAGGFEGDAFKQFQQRLATLPAGDPAKLAGTVNAQTDRTVLIAEKPGRSTAISMGFNVDVKRGDPDFFKLRLAAAWLGEHRQGTGRLFMEIREKRGLNYGDYAYIEEFLEHPGTRFQRNNIPRRQQHFEIWIRPVETANAVFALRAALWQFDSMVRNGIPEDELMSTRDYMTGYSRLWEQTLDRRLGYAIDGAWYGVPDFLDSFRKAMTKMTAAEVNDAIRRHLDGRAMQIAIVTADGAAMKQALVTGKPTSITYPTEPPADVKTADHTIQSWPLAVTDGQVKVMPVSEAFK